MNRKCVDRALSGRLAGLSTQKRTVRTLFGRLSEHRRAPWSLLGRLPAQRRAGQMTVELAVCVPVVLAVLGVALNTMAYLNVCARFDRVAAEAVRIEASSAGHWAQSTTVRAERIRLTIQESFAEEPNAFNVDIAVLGSAQGALGIGGGIGFAMLPGLEIFECSVTYYPWPFDRIVFVEFFSLTHARHYAIDPYRPGVVS
ncbi:MAG: hypothetical protein LBC35_01290 [Coriobacteriales bacterium]|nr:hypothetical protein [Coriobacteriales bacterium]